jgi:acetyl esterase/lipase
LVRAAAGVNRSAVGSRPWPDSTRRRRWSTARLARPCCAGSGAGASITGWGRLLAAEGTAGVAFEHRAVAEAGFDAVVAEVGAALAAAEAGGPPVELVDLPDAHHAFDTVDDTDASRDAIRRILGFLRAHLAA